MCTFKVFKKPNFLSLQFKFCKKKFVVRAYFAPPPQIYFCVRPLSGGWQAAISHNIFPLSSGSYEPQPIRFAMAQHLSLPAVITFLNNKFNALKLLFSKIQRRHALSKYVYTLHNAGAIFTLCKVSFTESTKNNVCSIYINMLNVASTHLYAPLIFFMRASTLHSYSLF